MPPNERQPHPSSLFTLLNLAMLLLPSILSPPQKIKYNHVLQPLLLFSSHAGKWNRFLQDLNIFFCDLFTGYRQHYTHGHYQQYRFVANVANYWAIMCQPRALRSGMSEEAVGRRCMCLGASYRGQLYRQIPCPWYGVKLSAGFMAAHRIRIQGKDPEIDLKRLMVSQTEHLTQVYEVRFPKITTQWSWPFSV